MERIMAIYFYGCTTMDGYLADKNHQLEWLFETGSPEETNYKDFYQKMDIAIMGRRTFNSIEGFDNIKTFYPTTKTMFLHTMNNFVKKGLSQFKVILLSLYNDLIQRRTFGLLEVIPYSLLYWTRI